MLDLEYPSRSHRVASHFPGRLAVLIVFAASTSFAATELADGKQAGTERTETAPDKDTTRAMVGGNTVGLFTFISETPMLFGGISFDPGLCVAAGVSFEYARDGSSEGATENDRFSASAAGYVFYAAHNKLPFSFGPELLVSSKLTKSHENRVLYLQPGLGMYVAPFNAPLVLGSALSVRIELDTRAGDIARIKTVVPGLRLAWIF